MYLNEDTNRVVWREEKGDRDINVALRGADCDGGRCAWLRIVPDIPGSTAQFQQVLHRLTKLCTLP